MVAKGVGRQNKGATEGQGKIDIISEQAHKNVYTQFCDNFSFYIRLVEEVPYKRVCKERGCYTFLGKVRDFLVDRVQSPHSMMGVVLQTAEISGLPFGTWLMGDVEYLYKNGIIVLADKCSFHIAPAYLTDGIYFYSRHIDHAVPLGAKKEFQKMIDDCFDLRVWKYQQPT